MRPLAREAELTLYLGYPACLDRGRLHAQFFRYAVLQLSVGWDWRHGNLFSCLDLADMKPPTRNGALLANFTKMAGLGEVLTNSWGVTPMLGLYVTLLRQLSRVNHICRFLLPRSEMLPKL